MPGDAVEVRGLRKTYRGVTALSGVDLHLPRGEVFALLGPNGAGKTTTLEILEGYRSRDAGQVAVLGADPAFARRSWRARIGVVLQDATDAGELTVREVVGHFALYYPSPRDPAEVIALVGLVDKERVRVQRLSGGQRRRLDVALGILGRPELLFLDEPTTGFDAAARRRFWTLVRTLAADGTTILLTTHYLEEAEALADRVAVIARGRTVAAGVPGELGDAPAAATVCWAEAGQERSVRTVAPTRTVCELASRFDGEVPELVVHRPTLEDAYLALLGEHADSQEGRAS